MRNKLYRLNNSSLIAIFLALIAIGLYMANTAKEINSVYIISPEIVFKKPAANKIMPENGNPALNETVVFNLNSHKYHKLNCKWAIKCKHCIEIPKSAALKRGGLPCKICGGAH